MYIGISLLILHFFSYEVKSEIYYLSILMLKNGYFNTDKHLLCYLSLLEPVFTHCQQDLAKSLNKCCTKQYIICAAVKCKV